MLSWSYMAVVGAPATRLCFAMAWAIAWSSAVLSTIPTRSATSAGCSHATLYRSLSPGELKSQREQRSRISTSSGLGEEVRHV